MGWRPMFQVGKPASRHASRGHSKKSRRFGARGASGRGSGHAAILNRPSCRKWAALKSKTVRKKSRKINKSGNVLPKTHPQEEPFAFTRQTPRHHAPCPARHWSPPQKYDYSSGKIAWRAIKTREAFAGLLFRRCGHCRGETRCSCPLSPEGRGNKIGRFAPSLNAHSSYVRHLGKAASA